VAHPFFDYDPNKEGPGVTGKGMVAIAVPGTGHGAHRALKKGLARRVDSERTGEKLVPPFTKKVKISRAAENWPRQHL